ncbi:MAG: hypothetical protein KF838_14300 [Phycisphaeraceae bacterium]|nr:MAG: hypothetical protein KF838_14300 [Phycisphaeraceae bacterium]
MAEGTLCILSRIGAVAAICAGAISLLGGCASNKVDPESRSVSVAPGQYEAAFDAARETLRRYDFTLDRVDARSGVITAGPRFSLGLMNPFDPVQSTAEQEVRELGNQEGRRVRIVFARPDDGQTQAMQDSVPSSDDASEVYAEPPPPDGLLADGSLLASLDDDLRNEPGAMLLRVDVVVDRIYRPGRRIETTSIRHSSTFQDPDLTKRGMQPSYSVSRERDDLLAARLAEDIRKRLASGK